MTSSDGKLAVLLAFCAGNSPVTGEFPAQRLVMRSFDVSWRRVGNEPPSKSTRTVSITLHWLTRLLLERNDHHFVDDIFRCIFLNDEISLKYIPCGRIENNPALVQITTQSRTGDKPLFEPMMANLLMHICVTRYQWVNTSRSKNKWYTYTSLNKVINVPGNNFYPVWHQALSEPMLPSR